MGLPLPRVVADVGPGGGINTAMGANNALAKQTLESQYYAPLADAEMRSKIAYANFLPYQLQSQALSNPMVWAGLEQLKKTNPAAADNYLKNMMNSLPTPQSLAQGNSLASQKGPGLLNMIMDVFSGGKSSNPITQMPDGAGGAGGAGGDNSGYQFDANGNNVTASPSQINAIANGNANQSAPTSLVAPGGVGPKMTAGYQEQPFSPGKTVNTGEKVISTAGAGTTDTAQTSLINIQNLKPILQDISKGAEKWLAPGKSGQLDAGQAINWLQQKLGSLNGIPDAVMKQLGVTTKDISDYQAWKANQEKAVETIIKARGWANNEDAMRRVSQIIQPVPGEGKEYGDRVTKELDELEQNTAKNYSQVLNNGIDVGTPPQNAGVGSDAGEGVIQSKQVVDGKTYVKINGEWNEYKG